MEIGNGQRRSVLRLPVYKAARISAVKAGERKPQALLDIDQGKIVQGFQLFPIVETRIQIGNL